MQNPVLQEVAALYSSKKDSIQSSRTAKLWLQYMDMITILRNFITAERLGDWILYLETLKQMLPYLAASGHNLYTKSVVVFLNDMQDLPLKHPEVYQQFLDGMHVVRRSNRQWAEISPDLAIEQGLVRKQVCE